jgi:hypothetical protein
MAYNYCFGNSTFINYHDSQLHSTDVRIWIAYETQGKGWREGWRGDGHNNVVGDVGDRRMTTGWRCVSQTRGCKSEDEDEDR